MARAPARSIGPGDMLIVIDVQRDFCAGGRLAVPGGDEIVADINQLMETFQHVVLAQDWHPADHLSFASQHPGKAPFDSVTLGYGAQVLWPDHCVQETAGAAFHPSLRTERAELIIRKGFRREIDSYSAFHENDRQTVTGLGGYLKERGFTRVFLTGLALDYCVCYSAIDARRLGFEAIVIEDACRAIDMNGSLDAALSQFAGFGVDIGHVVDWC